MCSTANVIYIQFTKLPYKGNVVKCIEIKHAKTFVVCCVQYIVITFVLLFMPGGDVDYCHISHLFVVSHVGYNLYERERERKKGSSLNKN